MWKDKEDWELMPGERAEKTLELRRNQKWHEEMQNYNRKPDAPFVNLGNLKFLVKELLDKHFKKIAIMTVISLVVSGIFTWLVWPKSESEVVGEAKAKAEKMKVELLETKDRAERLAKEKEELLAAKARELEQQKQPEAQNIKSDAPESKEEKKKNGGDFGAVFFGYMLIAGGIVLVILGIIDWAKVPTGTHFIMVCLPACVSALGLILILCYWPRSETLSETAQQNSENAAKEKTTEISAEKSKPIPRKFISRATVTFKEALFNDYFGKYNDDYFFYLKLDDGRKGKLQVDSKFFALAKVGEVIAIYEGDEFVPEEKKEEKPEEKRPAKKRVEY